MIAANRFFCVLSDPYGGSGKGKKPEDLFCRCPQVLLRVLRIHGFFQCGHSPDNREECVDPGVIAGGGVFGDASGEGQDSGVIFPGKPGHAYRGFSHAVW